VVVPQLESALDSSISTKYSAITDSVAILSFLDAHRTSTSTTESDAPARSLAPSSIEQQGISNDLIKLVHAPEADPNFLLLSARNEEELKAKSAGLPGNFIRGRKKALDEYSKEQDVTDRVKNFYADKIKATE